MLSCLLWLCCRFFVHPSGVVVSRGRFSCGSRRGGRAAILLSTAIKHCAYSEEERQREREREKKRGRERWREGDTRRERAGWAKRGYILSECSAMHLLLWALLINTFTCTFTYVPAPDRGTNWNKLEGCCKKHIISSEKTKASKEVKHFASQSKDERNSQNKQNNNKTLLVHSQCRLKSS